MGIRHGFGLWLQPITQEMGWTRESRAGHCHPEPVLGRAGHLRGHAGRPLGAFKVLIGGSVLYALGLVGMALSPAHLVVALTAGVLIGAAQAGTTYAVIYGVLGRQIPAARRSWAMGVAGGGRLVRPVLHGARGGQADRAAGPMPADTGAVALLIAALAFGLREPGFGGSARPSATDHWPGAGEAWTYPSFLLLGGLLCLRLSGHVHRRAHAQLSEGLRHGPQVASYSLALVGLFNIFGTYLAGNLGQKLPKRYLLSGIYGLRSVVIVAFCWHRCRPGRSMPSRRHGLSVAVHRAADQCHHRPDLRRAASVHAGRLCLLQPPDRQLPGRMAGRLSVRHQRQLRHGLVPLDCPGHFAAIVNLPVREQPWCASRRA
jgi:hypothetical protein